MRCLTVRRNAKLRTSLQQGKKKKEKNKAAKKKHREAKKAENQRRRLIAYGQITDHDYDAQKA